MPSGRIASTMFCASGRARGSLSISAPIEKRMPAPQPFGDDGRVRDVDAGGLGGAEQVAGLRELQGAPHGVDRAGIFERQVVGVIGDHQRSAATRAGTRDRTKGRACAPNTRSDAPRRTGRCSPLA